MVQCRWRGDRGGSRYNALEKDKLFFSTAVGIVSCYDTQIWVFRNKKYDNISVLKVHSIDFHDKRIKTVSYANRNLLRRKIIFSYFFGNNEW